MQNKLEVKENPKVPDLCRTIIKDSVIFEKKYFR